MNQFVSTLFKSTVSKVVNLGLTKDLPNVSTGERSEAQHGIWTLHEGMMRDSGLLVTIFHFESTGRKKDYFALAQNAYKKMKSIRHPEMLRFIDGAMTNSSVYIVTDRVYPVMLPIDLQLLTLGIFKLASLLKFLNHECGILHGNIQSKSIFVTEAGEFKLGGLELLSSPKDTYSTFMTHANLVYSTLTDSTIVPPEFKISGPHFPPDFPFAPDLFFFGALVSQWVQGTALAASLQPVITQMMSPVPSQRTGYSQFLSVQLFSSSEIVAATNAIEAMPAMTETEKNQFIDTLSVVMENFPLNFNVHKILPILLSSVELGTISPKSLIPVFKVSAVLSEVQFRSILVEPLAKLFTSTDRALRMALLEHLDKFVDRLDNKLVQSKIFPAVVMGFSDVVPVIREQTLKSMVLLAPKLNERLLNNDLLRYLGKSQTDAEPTIRTNACVCLAKIASHLTQDTRKKVLVPGLIRSLRDTFAPAKLAGVSSLSACIEYFDREELAISILPALAPLLLDMDPKILDLSFQLVETIVSQLKSTIPTLSSTSCQHQTTHDQLPPLSTAIPETPVTSNYPMNPASNFASSLKLPVASIKTPSQDMFLGKNDGQTPPPSIMPLKSTTLNPTLRGPLSPTSFNSSTTTSANSIPNAFASFFQPSSMSQATISTHPTEASTHPFPPSPMGFPPPPSSIWRPLIPSQSGSSKYLDAANVLESTQRTSVSASLKSPDGPLNSNSRTTSNRTQIKAHQNPALNTQSFMSDWDEPADW